MPVPNPLKIYHIVHVDRLASIVEDGCLFCDARIVRNARPGTTIGMQNIKTRRLSLSLDCHPGLMVGGCVPFYFCPRSVMLFILHKAGNDELSYRGGQTPIVHLESDYHQTVAWAEANQRRWAFTLSNAGARYFEDRSDTNALDEISWDAVQARHWAGIKEGKQAEFLIERSFPWELVERVGVHTRAIGQEAFRAIAGSKHRPPVQIIPEWYY